MLPVKIASLQAIAIPYDNMINAIVITLRNRYSCERRNPGSNKKRELRAFNHDIKLFI